MGTAIMNASVVGMMPGESAPDPRLFNADLAPTGVAHRTWSTYNYIALWFAMSMEVIRLR